MTESQIELAYWDWMLDNHPECYTSKDAMLRNWEQGFLFDEFAGSLGLTLEQLIGALS